MDSPASSVLLYGLSSAGPLLVCLFGSNESTSHSPKHPYLLFRLVILIGCSARESAVVCRCLSCVSLFDGRDCSGGTPPRHDSFVKELVAPILPCPYTCIMLRVFHVTSGKGRCSVCELSCPSCCWPSQFGTTAIMVCYHP